ncbi:FxsA family protein [Geomicrobium sp. JSM 1781026]|uniref:FxsA family protein n=1 Tax=Geomicrobium sp. JSM 1781026 TaxID=3344580 RepID=UPI0035C11D29
MGRFIVLLLLLIPIIEILGIWMVGSWLGVGWTVLLMLATSVIGFLMARSQGRQAWQVFMLQVNNREVPTGTAIDGVCILLAGFLLIAPGFVTDLVGFILLVPFTRNYVRAFLTHTFHKLMASGKFIVIKR